MSTFDFGTANAKQREAIETTEGPLRILAGPGTGKTFTIVKRIVYLIKEKGVNPEEILVSTFTDKAADELITRITDALTDLDISINVKDMYIGTIHSICLRILDEYIEYTNIDKHYGVIDERTQVHLISSKWNWDRLAKIKGFEEYFNRSDAHKCVQYINTLEDECVNINDMIHSDDPFAICMGNAMLEHRKILKELNKITYSTMQTEMLALLNKHPEVLKKIQSKIKYFLIDEYQDTNHLQETILLKLASENNNICVVGDDDQGIYRFRGASVGNLINFKSNFRKDECKEVVLNINYRSNKQIIDYYNKWMKSDLVEWKKFRVDKDIEPASQNESKCVITCLANSSAEWGDRVCDTIIKLKENGKITNYNQIAYLSVSLSKDKTKYLIRKLERNGIPVYAPRSNRFFDRQEVKEFLGCLILAFGEYINAIDSPYFREDCVAAAKKCVDQYPDTLGAWAAGMRSDKKFKKGKTITGIAYEIIAFEPFKTYLSVTPKDGILAEREIRNISKILQLIAQYQDISSRGSGVITEKNAKTVFTYLFNSFLNSHLYKMYEHEDKREYAPSGCVSFLTIHQSKGMEFPVVIVDISEKLLFINSQKSVEKLIERYSSYKEYEPRENIVRYDFWRKYYTAFSRAQNLLILTADNGGDVNFEEICKPLPSYENFDFSTLEYAKVKKVRLKERYAFTTDISVYENCPRQYKFLRVYGFPQFSAENTVLGIVVHETIEHINKQILDGNSNSVFKNKYIWDWIGDNYEKLAKKDHFYGEKRMHQGDWRHKAAYWQAVNYIKFIKTKQRLQAITDSEAEVSHVEEEYILEGQVDMVYKLDDGIGIIDFKTGKKPSDPSDKTVKHYRRQLEVYAYLLGKKTEKQVKKGSLYYTGAEKENVSPFYNFNLSNTAVENTIKGFEDTVSKIQNNEFDKGASDKSMCSNCELRHYCKL